MSFASFIRDGKFSASLYSYFSTNINKDLTVVLQPLSLSPIVYFVSFYITIHFTWSGVFSCNKFNPIIAQSLI